MILRRLPTAAAIALVIIAYVFFASIGTWEFRRVQWYAPFGHLGGGYYAGLAEGFRTGHLYMAQPADPQLAEMKDPYNYIERQDVRHIESLWDASYFRGHYYLYFTPIPSLIFYLPFRVVAGAYPPDALAAVIFATWGFLALVVLLHRTLIDKRWLPLWILLLGFGNVVPFTLVRSRVYEVAALTGMALTAMWALSLHRFLATRTRASAIWMGVWLALSINARANLLVLVPVVAYALWRARDRRAAIATAIPLAIVAVVSLAYNFARFHNFLEAGHTYQMTFVTMRDHPVCSLCTIPEGLRFANNVGHYLFWPISVASKFPYVDVQISRLDPAVSFVGGGEQVAGIAALVPLTMAGTLFAILFALKREERDEGTRAAMLILAGAWLTLFGLSACWWVVARYTLDFMLLMIAASIVLIEAGLARLRAAGVMIWPLRIGVIALALYSILAGFFLGFMGPMGEFERANPDLYHRLEKNLTANQRSPG